MVRSGLCLDYITISWYNNDHLCYCHGTNITLAACGNVDNVVLLCLFHRKSLVNVLIIAMWKKWNLLAQNNCNVEKMDISPKS